MSENLYSGRWEIFRFRPYVISFIGSMLGTGMQFIGIGKSQLAMQLTGTNSSVAYVQIFTSLPGIMFSPVIGVFVDWFDRKWIALSMDVFRASVLVIIPFLWWKGLLEAWHLYTATFLVALGDKIYTTAAMSLIREILPLKMILYANLTNAIVMQVGALLGSSGFRRVICRASGQSV